MGTGYIRNDTSNNIANGNVIDAADLDGEFDSIVSAFSNGSGHTHDGTTSEGGAVTMIGPVQDILADGTAIYPKADAVYDLGKTAASFDVAYVESINLAGTALTATATEINYSDGVTSAIQTQLDNKQPLDADLTAIAALANTDSNFIVGNGTAWVAESGATARTSLGLGTAATTASTAYATAAQGTTADAALPKAGGALTGAVTTTSTFDGRDVSVDGTKLDTIETNADVTDTANVTAAGALMDSEVDADIKTLSLPASTTISAFGASLIDDAAASNARTTLGLGTAATTASTAYATSTQGTTADAALPKTGGAMTGAITTNSTFDGVDIAVRDGVLTTTTTTANNALPKSGGAMTGAITTNSTFDGRDVATDGTKLDGIDTGANLYVHPTTAGNKHIPTGGTVGQILENSASGTAVWSDVSSLALGHLSLVYTRADSYTWVAPEDCTVLIQIIGAGGSGGGIALDDTAGLEVGASGGSGGGYSRKTVSLSASDTLSFTVGAGGASESLSDNAADHAGNTGGTTTCTGPASLSMTANGGSGGSGHRVTSGDLTFATQPSGGTASGGDTNVTGQAGTNVTSFTPPSVDSQIYLWPSGSFSCGFEGITAHSQDDYNLVSTTTTTVTDDTLFGSVFYAHIDVFKGSMQGNVSGSAGNTSTTGGTGGIGCGGASACDISSDNDTGTRTANTGAGGNGCVIITITNLS